MRVADNGPGLPEGSESQIFDKFFRGSTGAPDGRRGVGLGLAICRAIVEAHGGTISARNRSQGGAEFIVDLPRNESPPEIVPEADVLSTIS
jgi:two-component system sensor histidine kinase KdpD